MTENHLQIFSLKSNLISNAKGTCLSLGAQKSSSQPRRKNIYFSNMFQTIRHNIGLKQKTLQQNNVQNDKQNSGMIIQVRKFKAAYGHETPLIAEPPRMSFMQSRSFLIRSHHQKKPAVSSSQIKHKQAANNTRQINIVSFLMPLKYYNFQSANNLKSVATWKKKQRYCESTDARLAILIPYLMIKHLIAQKENPIWKLFQLLELELVGIFVLLNQKQHLNFIEGGEGTQVSRYCHFLIIQDEKVSNSNHRFIDLNTSDYRKLPPNLLFIQNHFSKRQSALYFPYFDYFTNDHISIQTSHAKKKCTFIKIKSIESIKWVQMLSDTYIKLQLTGIEKKQKPKQQIYYLGQEVKIQLQHKNRTRYFKRNKNSGRLSFALSSSQMEGLQQKLIAYSKIIKKQREESTDNAEGETTLIVEKQGRRSLASKSSFQVINELIRNNGNICKQISSYISQTKDIQFLSKPIICDNILYYSFQ